MNRLDTMKRRVIVPVGILVLTALFILDYFICWFPTSDVILSLTAIIVLWYTVETYYIRVANQETLYKSHRPVVGFNLFANKDDPYDAHFRLVNHSDYPVAVRVKMNFRINDEIIPEIWPAYEGREYWNLQYQQSIEGNFDILKIYLKSTLFSQFEIKDTRDIPKQQRKHFITTDVKTKNGIESDPILTSTVEVFSENDRGERINYPPMKFQFDPYRDVWIPTVTFPKPYWDYDSFPPWA